MSRIERLAEGVTLRKPWGKTPLKAVVACRACDWTWKPVSGFGNEPCPKCSKIRSVRDRKYEKNITALKPGIIRRRSSSEWERTYRNRSRLLVGRGRLECVGCGCDKIELLEINHKNGGGGKEFKELGNKFYRDIAKMERTVDDLELLCRPCNAVHYLQTKFGPLSFKVLWGVDAD
jgi:hypothetical protein